MSNQSNPKRRRRTWLRWTFIVLIVGALVYMSLKTASFLKEADMALGRKPLVIDPSLSDLLVNNETWEAPDDGTLQQSQIHYFLRILTALDSLDAKGASTSEQRQTISQIMNQHMMTRASYTWIRKNIIAFAINVPVSTADSSNYDRYKMLIPLVKERQHVIDRNLDSEIVK